MGINRTVNETFTEQEFQMLKERKGSQTWHDYIIQLSNRVVLQDEMAKHIEVTGVRKK